MKEKAKINYTVVIFLNFLLVFSISVVCIFLLVQNADANQDNHTEQSIEQRFTDWTVYDFDSIFLYTTHGQAVHGHRFGFMKRPGYCESDLFYFSWSTYKDEVRSYEGEEVTFQMKINKDDNLENNFSITINDFAASPFGIKINETLKPFFFKTFSKSLPNFL